MTPEEIKALRAVVEIAERCITEHSTAVYIGPYSQVMIAKAVVERLAPSGGEPA